MKELNEVIQALTCCCVNEDHPCIEHCPYYGQEDCLGKVMKDALELLKGFGAKKG